MTLHASTTRAVARLLGTAAVLALASPAAFASDVLVPFGASWRYLDDGSNQATAWRAPLFPDGTWVPGPAQLGYGDGDEATVVSFGLDANDKHETTYFRHTFTVADPSLYTGVLLRVLRDDGAVVYLNGSEVARPNMPGGLIFFETLAASTISGPEELQILDIPLSPLVLVPGDNVLAVEIHQRSVTSSDISFDLELIGSDVPLVIRGPYLQLATTDSIIVRWRTDVASTSRVSFGAAPGSLTATVDELTRTTEHEIELTGLLPETRYYYSVGSTSDVLAGDTPGHYFETAPPIGSSRPTRVWVLGDSGTAGASAASVREAYETATGGEHTDLWLMLGDNAYLVGSDVEYQNAVFNMYPEMLRKTHLWSTRGNHDQGTTYMDVFNLPTAGQAGGVPSGTEAYYSFDWANVHFVCLDSFISDRSVGGAMWLWLRTDLAANTQEWTVAFWHHPPYSKGSHDSDTESGLAEMRTNFLPLLENGGVDLVLCGHSHSYERSFLIDGHYGLSSTFGPAHIVDGGDGSETGTGAYAKEPGPSAGAVYCVAGSSGQTGGGPLNHPAMFHSVNVLGSVVLEFDGPRLDLTFLDAGAAVEDELTLLQNGIYVPYCYGDGYGTGCPCLNSGATGRGCDNSASTGGVLLDATGDPATNSVVLGGAAFPPAGSPTVVVIRSPVRAAGGLGSVFGDGLLCVAPPVVRVVAGSAGAGTVALPLNHGAGSGSFNYQLWYRNTPIGFCDPAAAFNLSNGLTIAWP